MCSVCLECAPTAAYSPLPQNCTSTTQQDSVGQIASRE
ncbi:hypothetical protein OTSANNIE_1417 [Anaplasma phagocytophilum str. Annie]|nr:hypothetical protein APHNYW_1158 [Anaplasma phagocytophilum str. ApNYW]KJV98038.1 hypothetical protein OTSANNIE_1417 [Anaplasma phagocytophilum str. Annie]